MTRSLNPSKDSRAAFGIAVGEVLAHEAREGAQVLLEVGERLQVQRVVDVGVVRMQLDEFFERGDRLRGLALLVVGVGDLDLRLLREAPEGELGLELLVELDRRVPVLVVELLLGGLVELRGGPILLRIDLVAEQAASGEREREEERGQCRYTSIHGESRFAKRKLYRDRSPFPRAAPHDSRELAGLRLDQALAQLLPEESRSRLARLIEEGHVRVDGERAAGKLKLKSGESVEVALVPRVEASAFAAEAIALDVVHEDEDVLVVNKPAGLVVHPGSGNWAGTMLNALLHHAPGSGELARAGIVHRLDKDTSGLLVVAKNEPAQLALVRQLQERTVKRTYLALARGKITGPGKVDAPIGRHPVHRTRMAVVAGGKPAVTHYRVREGLSRAHAARVRPRDRAHAPDPRAPRLDRAPARGRPGVCRTRREQARAPGAARVEARVHASAHRQARELRVAAARGFHGAAGVVAR